MAKVMNLIRLFKKSVLRAEIVLGLAFARALALSVPFRWWRGRIGPIGGRSRQNPSPLTARQEKQARDVGRIVMRMAKRMPFQALCLQQAMTARWVLKRRGVPSSIEFGSRQRSSDGALALHAWLVAGDQVVTGQEEYETYSRFSQIRRSESSPTD